MTPQANHVSRLAALEAGAKGASDTCGCCGYPADRALPPGRLTRDEIEAEALKILGGERFAKWPRCRQCRRLLPLDRLEAA